MNDFLRYANLKLNIPAKENRFYKEISIINGLTLVIAPNEDGLGTSAWCIRLIKEFSRQECISKLKIIVFSHDLQRFHEHKYIKLKKTVEVVRLNGISNNFKLIKRPTGSLNVSDTIKKTILPYRKLKYEYINEIRNKKLLEDADIVIDLGVPPLVRAVFEENLIRKQKSQNEIFLATFFDHAWSLSLRNIILSTKTNILSKDIEDVLLDIKKDESLAREAIIFNEPISSKDYYKYWKELIGHPPKVLPGCLGGPLAILEYFKDHDAQKFKKEMIRQKKLPQQLYEKARFSAKKILGIENQNDTLFISGGGTAVWDEVLTNMIDDYVSNEPNYNVLIYSPIEVKRRNIRLRKRDYIECGYYKHNKLIFISVGNTFTDTHHVLFPAFDLVLTRAGGGTVNDAIACRVPLVLIEEPFMWQVEQIRKSCIKLRLAEGVSLKKFQDNPRSCVELQNGKLKILNKQKENILKIPNHSEIWLVQELINLVHNSFS